MAEGDEELRPSGPQAARSDARSEPKANEAQQRWHRVPIELPPPGETRPFALLSRNLLLCNANGTPYVIDDACPHVRVSMAGAVLDGCVLECPHHGGRLDVRDGRPVRLPIRRGVETYAVRTGAEGGVEVAIPTRSREELSRIEEALRQSEAAELISQEDIKRQFRGEGE